MREITIENCLSVDEDKVYFSAQGKLAADYCVYGYITRREWETGEFELRALNSSFTKGNKWRFSRRKLSDMCVDVINGGFRLFEFNDVDEGFNWYLGQQFSNRER